MNGTLNAPTVTIGMPVYNSERYLEGALNSSLSQTYADVEIIISDNCSTDATQNICESFAARDNRIKYIRHDQNRGAGWNQSYVAEVATGQYFHWAHYDDLSAPTLIERCVDILEAHPDVVVCYSKTIVIDETGQECRRYDDDFHLCLAQPTDRFKRYHDLVRNGHECNPIFGVMRTETLKKTGLIGNYPSSDVVLLGELVLHGQFYELPDYLFYKRDHPNTSVRAHRMYWERLGWYDPAKKGKLYLTRWKFLMEYLRAIHQVQIPVREKNLCYLQMLRWLSWNWLWLTKDLMKAGAWPVLKPLLSARVIG